MCGPEVTLEADERLGHVKPETRTIGQFATELAMDPSELEHILHSLAGEGSRMDIHLAENWFETEIVNERQRTLLSRVVQLGYSARRIALAIDSLAITHAYRGASGLPRPSGRAAVAWCVPALAGRNR